MTFFKWIASFAILLNILSTHSIQSSDTADYIIVGVGNAGGLLAKRLTDDNKTSVIGLHSGKNFTNSFILKYAKNTTFSVTATLLGAPLPFDLSTLDLPPDIKEQFQALLQLSEGAAKPLYETGASTPQPNADGREILWVISLPLAGATSINAGAWCRATDQVNAQWEAIAGPQWSVLRIQDIYTELERYHGKTNNPNARGFDGPIVVRQSSPVSKLSKVFSQAIINATGTPLVLDYNDPNTPIGVSTQFQLTRRGDKSFYRVSSATAFLNEHVMKRDGSGVGRRKLQVRFNSFALRTIWNGNKAVGVEYSQDGVTKRVFANKGVIVCAGLRSSPFLLQSGVGPAGLLTSLGIPVKFDNPNVGQGLVDQPQLAMLFTSNPRDSSSSTSNAAFSQIAWLPAPGGDPTVRQLRFSTIDAVPGITAALFDLVQPKSRGSVSINSTDPMAPPVIDLGFLSNPDDLALYISGLSTYIKNINIQLQQIDPLYQLIFPDPAILDDPVLLTEFVKEGIGTNMCFQSHCRMAPFAQGGVVDSNGRVYGVENLIVADDSIVPQCMDGSPMCTAYLIAENIARLLGY